MSSTTSTSNTSSVTTPKTIEGLAPFSVPGIEKQCETWYRVVGDIATAGKTPLICVHGGPGMSHDYLETMVRLTAEWGIPVVLYDQVGNGRSTHLPEKNGDEAFWSEKLFHAELENLAKYLGLDERGYDVMGHSWGGMMGATFAGRTPSPKGLRKLILANAPATNAAWEGNYNNYRSKMPEAIQRVLDEGETTEVRDTKEYEAAMMDFMNKHCCTVVWPEEFTRSFEWATKDSTVTMTMLGPSEFKTVGYLKGWTSVPALKFISVPTLVISGVDEGASGVAVKPFLDEIKDVKGVVFEKSTHMPLYEESHGWFQVIGEWLSE